MMAVSSEALRLGVIFRCRVRVSAMVRVRARVESLHHEHEHFDARVKAAQGVKAT